MINRIRTSILLLAVVVFAGFGAAAQAQPYCQSDPSKEQRAHEPRCAKWTCLVRTHCLVTPTTISTDNRCVEWTCEAMPLVNSFETPTVPVPGPPVPGPGPGPLPAQSAK